MRKDPENLHRLLDFAADATIEVGRKFVENQIAIKHFELRNGIFIIQFLPLSDAEIEDLNFDRTKLIQSNREL